MDPLEEQAAELEALEAIFDAEYRLVEEATETSGARFQIDLADDVKGEVKFRLLFTHTKDYPEAPIAFVVHAVEGLSTPKRRALQEALEKVAVENADMPSAYTLCEAAKDWIEENVIGQVAKEEEESNTKFETLDATQGDKVEVISSKAAGTPVTVESFAEWRESFTAEMDKLKSKEDIAKETNTKMTGREFFESKATVVSTEGEGFWEQEAAAMTA